ncbi:MarR family transcriptional regulator [Curtobacterium sp. MCSS17_015]|uniref:MarR family winged helix-turn-helix transcriptional regulator n=1 Tax=Curtobacterium sp. MCSS17_015 TaxID=2175666 RepID=UPI0015E8AC32|nr:MarR family transcriptional regulator [Curtobacterium sp. MCSS17_015]WIB27385.1 MarR family transcriptional regulator [Curtobacterium sp. MCSS17_015]
MAEHHEGVPVGVLLLESVNRLRAAETMLQTRARARMALRASDFQALQFLAARGSVGAPARATDLADVLGVTSAAATQTVDRLVGRGLVERQPDPDDRRSRIIRLTADGERGLSEAYEDLPGAVQELLDAVPTAEAERMIALAAAVQVVVDRTATRSL